MIAMTLAPGREIRKFVEDIFSANDRTSKIEECKKILLYLGKVLGELHTKKAVEVEASSELYLPLLR